MSILTITEAAAAHLSAKMALESVKPEAVLLSVSTKGCSGKSYDMKFIKLADAPKGAEQISEHGVTVVIDPLSQMYLMDSTMDYEKTDQFSSALTFKNPQVTGSCGCGQSFTMDTPKPN